MHITDTKVLGPRATRYLAHWRVLGYTGDYVPEAILQADAAAAS